MFTPFNFLLSFSICKHPTPVSNSLRSDILPKRTRGKWQFLLLLLFCFWVLLVSCGYSLFFFKVRLVWRLYHFGSPHTHGRVQTLLIGDPLCPVVHISISFVRALQPRTLRKPETLMSFVIIGSQFKCVYQLTYTECEDLSMTVFPVKS